MRFSSNLLIPAITILGAILFAWAPRGAPQVEKGLVVRIAFFPNVNHAPALIGLQRGRWKKVAPTLQTRNLVVNAGPEAMEALLAKEIDFAFVGPGPALNTMLKTKGKALRIIAGVCNGGASLVCRPGVEIRELEDLRGRRVGTPQIGGTQDISCRWFLAKAGLKPVDRGGDVELVAASNGDLLNYLKQGQIDAAWVPEPWASMAVAKGNRRVLDERDLWPNKSFSTAVLIARSDFAEAHPEIVAEVEASNRETIAWMNGHPDEAKAETAAALKALSGKAIPGEVLRDAWTRMSFSDRLDRGSLGAFVKATDSAGYLRGIDPKEIERAERTGGIQ